MQQLRIRVFSTQIPFSNTIYNAYRALFRPENCCTDLKMAFLGLSGQNLTENRPYTSIRTKFGPRTARYHIRTNSQKFWEAVYFLDRFGLGLSGQKFQIHIWPPLPMSGVLEASVAFSNMSHVTRPFNQHNILYLKG